MINSAHFSRSHSWSLFFPRFGSSQAKRGLFCTQKNVENKVKVRGVLFSCINNESVNLEETFWELNIGILKTFHHFED